MKTQTIEVGTQVKVRIPSEDECFPPDGTLIATVDEVWNEKAEMEYLISWKCSESGTGHTSVTASEILEVM